MKLFLILLCLISFSLSAQPISSRYELVKMDKNVNTFHHEAAPIVSPDGNTLYFFVQNHPDNTLGSDDTQDIWMSKKDANGVWGAAEHLRSPFNIHRSNQVFTVLPDGSLFIKGGKGKSEKGFSIAKPGGDLRELEVKDFSKMNRGRFYGASMSNDLKHIIMYFSEIENSANSDLYVSNLQTDGTYSRPQKLKLSTTLDDVGPFIGPDQKTLYFGSARQSPGRQGGVDIYKSTLQNDTWTSWSEPVNLGKPINTSALDYYFTMDEAGNVFTSRANKAIEGAQLDLYMLVPKTLNINLDGYVFNQKNNEPVQASVELKAKGSEPRKLQSNASGTFSVTFPEVNEYIVIAQASGYQPKELNFKIPLLYNDTAIHIDIPLTPIAKQLILSGNVYDIKTNNPAPANITLTKAKANSNFKLQSANGSYQQVVPGLGWYFLSASAEGYLNAVDSVELTDEDLSPFTKDIYLQPIEVGVTVRLKNIYFDFNQTTLKKESFVELNKVVDFLKQNQTVEIEISGHTDNKGSDEYNATLSQGRSQSVVNYVVDQGIEAYRLSAHGYGETKPIDTNDTEAGRANNRRVEFTVVKK